MATTDTRTSVGSDPGTGLVYDGFISYSRADIVKAAVEEDAQAVAIP